ncbi:unnamed protein product [Trichogramma brassicae]|uniref:Uncharacterized protein n=1 Tax=Trichogramma brassicae TaxID=86971 RepID=A0A6H5I9D6_9HYME|nr:unnamed protein product [Trichogramma brassicae]
MNCCTETRDIHSEKSRLYDNCLFFSLFASDTFLASRTCQAHSSVMRRILRDSLIDQYMLKVGSTAAATSLFSELLLLDVSFRENVPAHGKSSEATRSTNVFAHTFYKVHKSRARCAMAIGSAGAGLKNRKHASPSLSIEIAYAGSLQGFIEPLPSGLLLLLLMLPSLERYTHRAEPAYV